MPQLHKLYFVARGMDQIGPVLNTRQYVQLMITFMPFVVFLLSILRQFSRPNGVFHGNFHKLVALYRATLHNAEAQTQRAHLPSFF